MENSNAPISPLELLERQIHDWNRLANRLQDANPEDPQIKYCEQKIEQLNAELETLKA